MAVDSRSIRVALPEVLKDPDRQRLGASQAE